MFLEYGDVPTAEAAASALAGRRFSQRTILVTFLQPAEFAAVKALFEQHTKAKQAAQAAAAAEIEKKAEGEA